MDHERTLKSLGEPDLELQGFQVWIHGRQFPNLHDYWDGNWPRVTAHCGAAGASVFATGPIIHLGDLVYWQTQLKDLSKTLKGEASLKPIEPNLEVSLKATDLGHVRMSVSITPDHMSQEHSFEFEIDQSFIAPLTLQLQTILEKNPLRGDKDA